MRVKIDNFGKSPYFGEFLGLVLVYPSECDRCSSGDARTEAIVRPDHFGLMLMSVDPSRVQTVTPEQEAEYKP